MILAGTTYTAGPADFPGSAIRLPAEQEIPSPSLVGKRPVINRFMCDYDGKVGEARPTTNWEGNVSQAGAASAAVAIDPTRMLTRFTEMAAVARLASWVELPGV